jgi:integrin beta 3
MNTAERDAIAKVFDETVRQLRSQQQAETAELRREITELREMVNAKAVRGERGADGVDGVRGPAGKDGQDGIDGKHGERGLNGKDGRDGVDGLDGRDCDMDQVRNWVREFVAAIPKPQDGERGRDGINGKDGTPGRDGRDGERGDRGERGRDGANGSDGRDAAQLEILDGIVEGRPYVRNSYATHLGGLWRYTGIEWQCVMNGVAGIDVQQVNEREFALDVKFSNGIQHRHLCRTNAIIYQDVWQPKAYAIGDCVTWDGCSWIARAVTLENDKPGESLSWRLAVKRGRNGKST